jgi:hypothetical protein
MSCALSSARHAENRDVGDRTYSPDVSTGMPLLGIIRDIAYTKPVETLSVH